MKSIKTDPRVKIILFASLLSLTFICQDILALVALMVTSISISILSGKCKQVFSGLKVLGPVLVVAFLLWSYLYNYSLIYSYESTGVNFNIGFFMTFRLLLIILISLTFTSTVTPWELVNALQSFKLPYPIVFTLGLTFRHISTIMEDYKAIKEVQASRGLELEKGFLIKRIKNHIPVLMPLLIRSIENAEKMVLAMELKSFSFKRRSYLSGKLSLTDYLIVAGSLSALILSLLHYFLKVV